jgi:hypothetical protein
MRHPIKLSHVRKFDPNVDTSWLKQYLSGFKKACERVSGTYPSGAGLGDWMNALDPLQTLYQQSVNLLQFTKPRTVLVEELEIEVEQLCSRYVIPRQGPKKEYWRDTQLRAKVKEVLGKHRLLGSDRVKTDYQTEVRGDVITFPLYYQNGHCSFIDPISFAVEDQDEKQDEVRRLIYKKFMLQEARRHRDDRLLVLAHPPLSDSAKDKDAFDRCLRMLRENKVDVQTVEKDKEQTWHPIVERIKRDLGITD